MSNLVPGQYISQESVPAGWDLTDISCDDDNSVGDLDSSIATFNLEAGETVTCTFENTKRGSITVVKELSATGPAVTTFNFLGQGPNGLGPGSGFSLQPTGAGGAGSASQLFDDLEPGGYEVAELNPNSDGWELTSATCSDGSLIDAIDLAPGEDITCTFINSPLGSTTITKVSQGGEGLFSFEWGTSFGFGDRESKTPRATESTPTPAMRLRWVSIAPFGRPVVPLV